MSAFGSPPLDGYVRASSDALNHSREVPGGSIDAIREDGIQGWCVDPLAAGDPVRLELRLHTLLLAEFSTDGARPDIARCFGVETRCGFSFAFADIPAGLAGTVLARWGEKLARLPNEPADLHVTVKRQSVELPRWDGLKSGCDNKHLLYYLSAGQTAETIGWFDAEWYAAENPVARELGLEPFQHYRDRGFKEGRPPNATIKAELGRVGIRPHNPPAGPQARIVDLLAGSGLFDAGWYENRYDVPAAAALAHYVSSGAFLGYDPSPFFSSLDYLKANPEAAKGGFNPLAHLILEGFDAGRGVDALKDFRLTARDWLKGI